ncbi:ProQ/FINO family protein, partial [Vibrio splendidus]
SYDSQVAASAADDGARSIATASPDKSGSDVGARFIERSANSGATQSEAPSPQALLDEWYTRYPSAFFKGHTRPLMVGIHEVLASREPWPEKLVRRALACYVNLPRYLKAVREDAERIDLDGQPAGKVDAQSADHAHRKLDRLQGEKRNSQGRKHPGRQNERHNHKGRGKP